MRTEMGADAFAARCVVLEPAINMMRECAARAPGDLRQRAVQAEDQSAMVLYGVVLGVVP